jgi:hypothetical protein
MTPTSHPVVAALTLAMNGKGVGGEIISFFAAFWVILAAGFLIHWRADQHRHGRRPHRAIELLLLWVVVFGGLWTILAGLGLIDGDAYRDAIAGGYTPSMYAWEVGWADIAIGALGVACARVALRGQWMTATVAVLAISFGGDAIGHVMAWSAHGNARAANIGAIPADILQAGLAVVLLVVYRRLQRSAATGAGDEALARGSAQVELGGADAV